MEGRTFTTNLIGRTFGGIRAVVIYDTSIEVHTTQRTIKTFHVSDMMNFPIFRRGLFGCTLMMTCAGAQYSARFINALLNKDLDRLSYEYAKHLSERIDQAIAMYRQCISNRKRYDVIYICEKNKVLKKVYIRAKTITYSVCLSRKFQ